MRRTALSSLIQYFSSLDEPAEFTLDSLYEVEIDQHSLKAALRRYNYADVQNTPVLHVTIDLFLFQSHKFPAQEKTVNIYRPCLVYFPKDKELLLRDFESVTSPRQSIMDNILIDAEAGAELSLLEELIYCQQNQ
ncbi:MAG: hypothetical protein OEY01_11620 [Desulfobulbaceae bacterium]|nr:hypothetical protein [Desulfobulbaceae bacterium]